MNSYRYGKPTICRAHHVYANRIEQLGSPNHGQFAPDAGGKSTYPGGFKHLSARLATFTAILRYRVTETES